MAASIYVTSAEGRTGKSAVALGVLSTLLADAPRVGVFRPLIRSASERDRVLELLRHRATAEVPYEACVGVTYDDAHADPDAAMVRIVAAYQALRAECDAVVVVGSDFTDVAAPTELAFNARVAANLDTPVLLVLGGRSNEDAEHLGQQSARTPGELAQLAEMGLAELRSEHATVLAALVNRADPDRLPETQRAVSGVLPDGVPVWSIPEELLLVAPPVSEVIAAVDGELVRGSSELLAREVRDVVVAGMSMENVLPRLLEGSVVVIAADRSETLLAVTMAHEAPTFPTIAAIVLNGEFPLPVDVVRLLDGIDSTVPVVRTRFGTFDTVRRISRARGLITEESPAKLDTALSLFAQHVDGVTLRERLRLHRGGVRTPVMFAYELFERAAAAGAHIVLPEGDDDRILRAASTLLSRGTARLTILGNPDAIRKRGGELGLGIDAAETIDPTASPLRERFAVEYARLRGHKGVTIEQARDVVTDVSYFGTMMVHFGLADGMVSGATHTTAHTIRPSLEIIKTRQGVSVVSSVFFMALSDRVLVYGDCAVNPDPNAGQLADIAVSSAETAAQFGVEPRVAMLSYSTGESGTGADVDKVREATRIAREARPDLLIEGPIQYDAASDPATGAAKLPGSQVAGHATVFIFPDLNTGNNTYKAVQRSAGAIAVGPVLQGLAKPVNDLSRGATIEDILNTVAITAVQAGLARSEANR
ncbi:phosphate acetyltransferase [Leucobacter luti]|uniref:Phosphate acetyltransferase n=1 Tax=Leucobacter luti TaxID=340320 RepID=A0A4Q7TZF8_9MICO|nr:phosphate acetyltransferase [Leucobacter luti]MBL3699025.1 phosphate acetyltransferase [Leucobacter luti]RZT66524.1 phosphotransacetylase [Leucobacter luti]